ncbi:hypothetical protein A0J61_06848 [Choanephora cucurbitarum]|uniref:Uncharacterized protein n=1 Tax=Choanephora cucurbitarum TaxID=101091 RepID=A0A1C7N7T0_9FUNG|nr:hypothetical protein A0J61_06848 [Choanephora cucurbitarum]
MRVFRTRRSPVIGEIGRPHLSYGRIIWVEKNYEHRVNPTNNVAANQTQCRWPQINQSRCWFSAERGLISAAYEKESEY